MARGDILCPIDGLVLGLPTIVKIREPRTDFVVGDHIHLGVTLNATCANGHQWAARESFELARIA